jgi:hypothetical protein
MASMAGMTIGFALLGAGAVAVIAGIIAAGRREPAQVAWGEHVFAVKRSDQGSFDEIEFVRPDGSIAAAFAGSTDLVCDGPRLFLIDVDADDADVRRDRARARRGSRRSSARCEGVARRAPAPRSKRHGSEVGLGTADYSFKISLPPRA